MKRSSTSYYNINGHITHTTHTHIHHMITYFQSLNTKGTSALSLWLHLGCYILTEARSNYSMRNGWLSEHSNIWSASYSVGQISKTVKLRRCHNSVCHSVIIKNLHKKLKSPICKSDLQQILYYSFKGCGDCEMKADANSWNVGKASKSLISNMRKNLNRKILYILIISHYNWATGSEQEEKLHTQ